MSCPQFRSIFGDSLVFGRVFQESQMGMGTLPPINMEPDSFVFLFLPRMANGTLYEERP